MRIRYRAALVLPFAAEPHIEPNFPAGDGPLVPVSLGRFRGGVAERRPVEQQQARPQPIAGDGGIIVIPIQDNLEPKTRWTVGRLGPDDFPFRPESGSLRRFTGIIVILESLNRVVLLVILVQINAPEPLC